MKAGEFFFWVAMGAMIFFGVIYAIAILNTEREEAAQREAERERIRQAHIEDLIACSSNYSWVWTVTGFDEYGGEYMHIFAKKDSLPRIELASTGDANAVMKRLLAAGVVIHSGPPGTV